MSCQFYLKKRRQFCQFEAHQNEQYCHHHMKNDDVIECPVDNSHTVFKNKLNKHIKICTKGKQQQDLQSKAFFKAGVNSQNQEKEIQIKIPQIIQMQQEKNQDFKNFLLKLEKQYWELKFDFQKEFQNDIKKLELSDKDKNEKQGQLLIEKMSNLLNQNYTYIEFGAGKGYFSHIVQLEARRNKFDRIHDHQNYKRITIDIQNFDINEIPALFPQTQNHQIIGISKHMQIILKYNFFQNLILNYIGADVHYIQIVATDLTLQTLLNCKKENFKGMIIATCCHHKCNFQNYLNKPFLLNLFSQQEIQMIFSVSSWAVETNPKYLKQKEENQIDQNQQQNNDIKQDDFFDNLDSKQKNKYGVMAKRLLDIGRCLVLQENKMNVKYAKYCEFELTPENYVIIVDN